MSNNINNFQLAVSSRNQARVDLYDGVNAIYNLMAYIPIEKDTSTNGAIRKANSIRKQLSLLKVRANRITIFPEYLKIEFFPKGYQMAITKEQYVGLQVMFADFLCNSNIEGISILDQMYGDDPEFTVIEADDSEINFFPEFNSNCFGAYEQEATDIYGIEEWGEIKKWQ